ncbi:FAD-dependent oxidoreductase [Polycyclovorans algicola]|uniref:FAD-dependent oxidoreductase n=1 Tax=Polycyclovorans algicola TaxID=616992 RepID=UPI000693935A|nr:FAD-dependent oxidoreductase [Polycyclovorans algicola]
MITHNTPHWDETYDVIVVGSGAGGMTAALCAKDEGLSSVVIEQAAVYGGTSAVSGGGIWIPCNDGMPATGISDSPEEALAYLKHLTGGDVPLPRLEAYVSQAPKMVRHLKNAFGVEFRPVAKYPDYFPNEDGGKPGARTMEPVPFDAAQLGDTFNTQREPYKSTLVLGRISMDQVQAHVLFSRAKGWIWLTMKLMWRYWSDLGWRRKTWRDRRQVLGQALVASLRGAMLRKQMPLMLETSLDGLVEEGGRVVGVNVRRGGKLVKLRAHHGVIIASGGFEANQQMREQYLPQPTKKTWSAAPGINNGDGIRAGQALGAGVGFMNMVWGTPTVELPGASVAAAMFVERSLPGCVMVNGLGKRFVNEAAPYTEVVHAINENQARTGQAVPCWFIFDGRFRQSYPAGPMLPAGIQPDKKLPKAWWGKALFKADTVDGLASQIGVDAKALAQTIANMNRYAVDGKDPEFGKGDDVFQRYYADPRITPNPCLAPIVKAPFYALAVTPGEIGTKGGLLTNEHARVLREDGSEIEGLYAIGNCSAAVMGRTYAGPGATLGPAMTFGFIAARDIAAQAKKQPIAEAA